MAETDLSGKEKSKNKGKGYRSGKDWVNTGITVLLLAFIIVGCKPGTTANKSKKNSNKNRAIFRINPLVR